MFCLSTHTLLLTQQPTLCLQAPNGPYKYTNIVNYQIHTAICTLLKWDDITQPTSNLNKGKDKKPKKVCILDSIRAAIHLDCINNQEEIKFSWLSNLSHIPWSCVKWAV